MGSDVDDALCLALALASPELDLVAVTHVAGDTQLRARISRRLLDLAGRSDVPVYAGCEAPLAGGADRFVWFGNEGVGILDDDGGVVEREHAVDALVRLFEQHDDLELVTVGPLTNVAAALARRPGLAAHIARVTIMGGHLREEAYGGRDLGPDVDYNLRSDAEASLAVLTSGVPIRLVPINVTLQTWLTRAGLDRIAAGGGALRSALVAAVREWTPIMNRLYDIRVEVEAPQDNVAFLHDPLTLATAFDESFCRWEELPIEVVLDRGVLRTIAHAQSGPGTNTMRCATAVDAARFHDFFVDRAVSFQRSDVSSG